MCVDWKQSKHARKSNFSELGKLFIREASVFLQVFGENNVSRPQVYPHIDFAWIGSSPSMCEKNTFSELEKIVFLQGPISSHKTIRGHATNKMNRKGELQTSRISNNLRIWLSYSRVPQILKVLCVWYSWKYVVRLGFEPLKSYTLNSCTIFKL